MALTDFYIALALGLTLSLLVESFFGIIAGGMIAPGYLALYIDEPLMLLQVYLISLLVYLIVNYGISKFVILYGKRYFVLNLLVALALKMLIELFLFPTLLPLDSVMFRGIGAVVPGLLANTYRRQSLPITLAASLGLTLIVGLVLYLISI
ncbi:poly-gamma-glutamate biosynthesis protein PgsC [Alloiococcus otitis]|uniref:Poly-gamma-glutamate biosynthesis protein PgsC n=1 Tax=Alloiococcus otitis ATCC 51267 TaxID=883081 RepID=K9ECP3_9LACT|nr:poly-gamma-glutamate biosynthesis protein PgsC [Alloiococcus otitis]EKU93631.1 poly-gamma-glutamate biosynthesis protein PgsC [Alloiococcus otitis ATCC 51267]SUU80408.1 poly-gamma-glutamate biosynthesis protein PgsC [Alloiococcus otitis]